jgi:hypothetical protein
VLKVAHRFNFLAIRHLAISMLEPLTTSVQKIVLARRYKVDGWLPDAFLEVCMRSELPDDDEVARLKYDTFVKIARARDLLRTMDPKNAEARLNIIREVFGLSGAGVLPATDRPTKSSPYPEPTGHEPKSRRADATLKKRKREQSFLDDEIEDGQQSHDDGSSGRKKLESIHNANTYDSSAQCSSSCRCTICLRINNMLPTTRA